MTTTGMASVMNMAKKVLQNSNNAKLVMTINKEVLEIFISLLNLCRLLLHFVLCLNTIDRYKEIDIGIAYKILN